MLCYLSNTTSAITESGAVLFDDTTSLSIATGMDYRCCGEAGPCYVGAMSENNCYDPLPHQCDCSNPGVATWIISDIKVDTICKTTDESSSDCEDGAAADCFRKSNGTCDDDGGGWSFYSFCWVCGPGNMVLGPWEGERHRCEGDDCVDGVPVE